MGPYQRTPKSVARAIRYSGLGVRSVGPVGDFLERRIVSMFHIGVGNALLLVSFIHVKLRCAQQHFMVKRKSAGQSSRQNFSEKMCNRAVIFFGENSVHTESAALE